MSMVAEKDNGLSSGKEIRGDAEMPDIYDDQPTLKPVDIVVLSPSADDDEESVGFDPYDTATLYKK